MSQQKLNNWIYKIFCYWFLEILFDFLYFYFWFFFQKEGFLSASSLLYCSIFSAPSLLLTYSILKYTSDNHPPFHFLDPIPQPPNTPRAKFLALYPNFDLSTTGYFIFYSCFIPCTPLSILSLICKG